MKRKLNVVGDAEVKVKFKDKEGKVIFQTKTGAISGKQSFNPRDQQGKR